MKMENFDFPNGVTSYLETHFEITVLIYNRLDNENVFPFTFESKLINIVDTQGQGGLYELAESLTTEFENLYKDKVWDGDYFDTLYEFFDKELAILQ